MLSSTWIVIILKISGLSMGKISEFTQQDYQVIARNYADLKEAARKRCADVNEIEVANIVLRDRFGIDAKNMAIVSRIIKATIDAGFIKLADENASLKNRRYIPYWA